MTLGRAGADTLTHIVSIVALLALGTGSTAVIGYYQAIDHFDDIALISVAGFLTVVAIMMAYYSVQYQTSPSGGVIIDTNSGDGSGTTTAPVVGVDPTGKASPIIIPAGWNVS